MIPYLSESIKANYKDIRDTRAKTEHIEQIVNQLYQQFLTREQSQQTLSVKPHNKRSVFSHWRVIGVAVLATILMTIVGVALFISLSPNDPPGSPMSPTEPTSPGQPTIDQNTADFNKSYRTMFEELYMSTNGTNWTQNEGWMTNTSICTWYGVLCGEHLMRLSLASNNMRGTLPDSLGQVVPMYSLNFSRNHLEGVIPTSFAELDVLGFLDLSHNNLTHVNINKLLQLPSLIGLYLNHNQISELLQIPKLSTLSFLDLSHNLLVSTIPDISETMLKELNLSFNDIRGTLPRLPFRSIQKISLESNKLHGEIWRLKRVYAHYINLANNQFDGHIPFNSDELQLMTYLNLSNNYFSTVQATEVTFNPNMTCDASNIDFDCPIPDWLITHCSAKCVNR